jgi:hypothetical protein
LKINRIKVVWRKHTTSPDHLNQNEEITDNQQQHIEGIQRTASKAAPVAIAVEINTDK